MSGEQNKEGEREIDREEQNEGYLFPPLLFCLSSFHHNKHTTKAPSSSFFNKAIF